METAVSLFISAIIAGLGLFGSGPGAAAPNAPFVPAITESRTAVPSAERQTAVIEESVRNLPSQTSTAPTATAAMVPGLLPNVALIKKTTEAAPAPVKPPLRKYASAVSVPMPATAAQILAQTTTSISRAVGGGYKLEFDVIENGATVMHWPYEAQTIGGAGGIPDFTASYICNPPPGAGGSFAVRTSYACGVSLTPLSGSDLRTMSANFSFSTGPGEFFASPPSNMNAHLAGAENDGGFVFTNDDAKPISVLSETFDVSYTGLITSYGPLIMRIVDPSNAAEYIDYHLENIPPESEGSYSHSASGITFDMPLTIGAANAKMLPVEILGAHMLSVQGLNPDITITLAGVSTDRTDISMKLGSPEISWGCIVPSGFYDPNATSGPFANGEACQN